MDVYVSLRDAVGQGWDKGGFIINGMEVRRKGMLRVGCGFVGG